MWEVLNVATEKRLIDANALAEQVDNLCADWNENWIGNDNQSFILHSDVSDLISDAPTVDAVEVVRCKDCEFFSKTLSCVIGEGMFSPTPTDFCSCGKKKGGTGNGI